MKVRSLSRGTPPHPPSGFRTRVIYTDTKPLDPIYVYRAAMSFMGQTANAGWHGRIPTNHAWRGNKVKIDIVDSSTPRLIFDVGVAAQGLYDGLITMSHADRFVPAVVVVSIDTVVLGRIILSTSDPDQGLSTITSTNGTLNTNSGRWVDPQDKRFALDYSWRGPNIDRDDIFTAILQALIILSYDGIGEDFYWLNARSATGNCALNIRKPGPVDHPSVIPGVTVVSLTYVLADLFTAHDRFAGLDFQFVIQHHGLPFKPLEGYCGCTTVCLCLRVNTERIYRTYRSRNLSSLGHWAVSDSNFWEEWQIRH